MASTVTPASPPVTDDVATLAEAARGCHACELFADATQTVFGRGRPDARVMLVGEQPGDVEDRRGAPFVGPAGGVLDRALDAAGIDRDGLWVTNAVKHFFFAQASGGARRLHQTPKARHVTACRPWLRAEFEAVRPELVVCLGATAAKAVLGPAARVGADRGAVHERDSLLGEGAFVVTIHPSAVLRARDDDRDALFDGLIADLRLVPPFLG